jgi:hypothetical protein
VGNLGGQSAQRACIDLSNTVLVDDGAQLHVAIKRRTPDRGPRSDGGCERRSKPGSGPLSVTAPPSRRVSFR